MKFLFFFHTGAETGSEVALHRLICNADRTTLETAVACGGGGPLAKKFPSDVRVYSYSHALSFGDRVFSKNTAGLWGTNTLFKAIVRLIHERVRPDAWYINTIMQPAVVALAKELRIPCVVHSHEFELMLPLLTSAEIELVVNYPKLIVAASECAAEVMRVFGRQENLHVCYESIDLDDMQIDSQKSTAIRERLQIPTSAYVWAMSGTRDTNKNPLGFVRIADEVLKRHPNTYFLWIGGNDTAYSLYAKEISRKLNIHEKIFWLPHRSEDYLDYLNLADGFVLTSLNESLSIVTLEAAALGKPFVSFNSGGPGEIFREGMGVVVESWNVEDIAKAMLQVMSREIYLDAEVSKARAREFDVSVVVKQWQRTVLQHIP